MKSNGTHVPRITGATLTMADRLNGTFEGTLKDVEDVRCILAIVRGQIVAFALTPADPPTMLRRLWNLLRGRSNG